MTMLETRTYPLYRQCSSPASWAFLKLILIGGLLAFVTIPSWAHAPRATVPPVPKSFVLILADDLGVGDVGYNNVPSWQHHPAAGGGNWQANPPRTPHLDAMANAPHSLQMHRFYSGSPLCSPTRASILSGRSPDRDCIFTAEGCGGRPAWTCPQSMPFPAANIYTVAQAAREAGLRTIHVGKWHLGNFFPKLNASTEYPNDKWPVSNPGMAGFDEWHSTEVCMSARARACVCLSTRACVCLGVGGRGLWQRDVSVVPVLRGAQ